MSIFSEIKMCDPVEILAVNRAFINDTNENKISLMYSSYRSDRGEYWSLPVVKQAERAMANDETADKLYLPILGLESFTAAASQLLLGSVSPAILGHRTFSVQTVSATGGMYLIATFLSTMMDCRTVYNSKPTWGNFELIFKSAGFQEFKTYRYCSDLKKGLNIDGMLQDLRMAEEKSVIVLQVCGHNPTGFDPSNDEWKQIAEVLEERKLLPVMYCSFQGLASGDLDDDAWPVRHFVSRGMEMICCQSFSNIFGLYNERVGNVTFVVNDELLISKIKSQVSLLVLGTYMTPPYHGARIIAYILNNLSLFNDWKECLKIMANRMMEGRKELYDALQRLGTPGNWNHIIAQRGIYSYIGLSEQQCIYLIQNYHIYILRTGRINISNIRPNNVAYISQAIYDSVVKFYK